MRAIALFLALMGCAAPQAPSAPQNTPPSDPGLDRLLQRARAQPQDADAAKAAGLALMWLTLSGGLHRQVEAESWLERAFSLDPEDRELTRALGRFYNLRAVAGDVSKAEKQVEVYAAHLPKTPVAEFSTADFVAYSFLSLGRILALKSTGRLLAALKEVEALEEHLRQRAAVTPHDIELSALAGNFSFFFAGNIPTDRRRRVEEAVSHFERVLAEWEQLRSGAKDPKHCPNTRENFMFELAEGYLVLRRRAEAEAIYSELALPREPFTRPKQMIANVAKERLKNAERYLGDLRLMPPWPSDAGNCVVCHSRDAELGIGSLHHLDKIEFD